MNPFRLRRESAQFLMVDVQEKLIPAISGHEAILENILKLAAASKELSVPFLFTEQNPRGLGCTSGAILEAVGKTAPRFEKIHFSCCDEEGFQTFLSRQERPVTVVFGIETHICVLATVLDLLEKGRSVAVAADASGSRDACHAALALSAMTAAGALVIPSETVIYHLMGRAGTPEFKALLPLFKAKPGTGKASS